MFDFTLLTGKMLVPYALVLAGFAAGRLFNTNKEDIARLLIYLIGPVVVFSGVATARLEFAYLILPLIFFCLCSFFALLTLSLTRRFFPVPLPNLMAFAGGTANSGYFGIPVGLALYGQAALSPIILCIFGFMLFEYSLGFYIAARGRMSRSDSLKKVLKLPAFYAYIAGLTFNLSGLEFAGALSDLALNFRGAYSVLGMMMVGLAVADLRQIRIDWRFVSWTCLIKQAAWPLLVWLLLFFEQTCLPILNAELRQIVFFMATLPIAANTVAVAALFQLDTARAGIAVLVSTALAFVLVPALAYLY